MTEPQFVTVEDLVRHRLSEFFGGVRGSIESALPMAGFVVVWLARHELALALLVAGALAVAIALVHLATGGAARGRNLRYVGTGIVGVAVAAYFAMRSGRAADAFLPTILTSGAYVVAILVSILLRWPLVGFVVGAADPGFADDPVAWHRHPEIVRVSTRLTWVFLADQAIRVAVMLPLFLGGWVGWLGVAKIVLGWPLWAAVVAVMGWLLVEGKTPYVPVPTTVSPSPEELSGRG